VVLETEVTNRAALSLYERLDFVRDKHLQSYYMNGVDAYRLKLFLRPSLDAAAYAASLRAGEDAQAAQ
jgi:peptide alpha-N-acetyltransferase